MQGQRQQNAELKAWLEKRITELENRISEIAGEVAVASSASRGNGVATVGVLRPAWVKVLKVLKSDFAGLATAEVLSKRLGVNKSVASGYLSKLESLGLVKKKYNHTPMPGRYVFALTEAGEELIENVENSE